MAVPEVPSRETKYGLVNDGEGWFVVNAREARWRDYGPLGIVCNFEGKRRFRQIGVNINVLGPGEPMSMYHRENHQEGFLVVAGECLLIVEGQQRVLRAWDFVHCPSRTAHVILGAGDSPAVVVAVGARGGRKDFAYLVDEAARKHGAGVDTETTDPKEVYGRFPPSVRSRYRNGSLPDF